MGSYLSGIWRCRYFWLSLVKMDLRMRYRGSVLGLGWSLLQPFAMTVILCTVFHAIFHVEVSKYGPFLFSGLTFWSFVVTSAISGCQCFFQAESYIRQHPVPMAIYPLRTVLGAMFHFLLALVVVVLVTWFFAGVHNVGVLLCLVPSMIIFTVFGWSLAVLGGLANVYFPDTQHLTDIGFQILYYLTPIMYPTSILESNHMAWVLRYNPLVFFLQLVRQPILEGTVPSLQTYFLATLTAFSAAGVASLWLMRLERRVVFLL